MASDFPAVYYTGVERGPMHMLFPVDSAATFLPRALVFMNTTDEEIEECGADPALIMGFAGTRADQKFLYKSAAGVDRVIVEVISPEVEYGLCVGAGTLTQDNVGKAYGLAKLASTNWSVDLSDTSATRVTVIGADLVNQIAWVKFLPANLQGDGIAS